MKKVLVIAGVITSMVVGLAVAATAGPNDTWYMYLKASDTAGGNGLNTGIFGTKATGATDGYESTSDSPQVAGGSSAVISCFDLGPGGANNGYYKDLRAPLASATDVKVWNLKLWAQAAYTSDKFMLSAWNPTTGDLNGTIPVKLIVVNDSTGTYAANTVLFDWDSAKNGTSATAAYTFTFNNVKPNSSVNLQLVAGTVPEPGSMLAMLSGLVGLVGYGIRRRK